MADQGRKGISYVYTYKWYFYIMKLSYVYIHKWNKIYIHTGCVILEGHIICKIFMLDPISSRFFQNFRFRFISWTKCVKCSSPIILKCNTVFFNVITVFWNVKPVFFNVIPVFFLNVILIFFIKKGEIENSKNIGGLNIGSSIK